MPRYAVWFLLVVSVFYLIVSPVLSGFERICRSDTEISGGHEKGICGQELSYVINLICDGKFSLPKKRSVTDKTAHGDNFPRFSALQGQLLGKRNALSYLGTDKRFYEIGSQYQGIVCECCYHHCDMDELSQYCYNDNKDVK